MANIILQVSKYPLPLFCFFAYFFFFFKLNGHWRILFKKHHAAMPVPYEVNEKKIFLFFSFSKEIVAVVVTITTTIVLKTFKVSILA